MGGASNAVFDMSNTIGVNPATVAAFDRTALVASFLNQKRSVKDAQGLTGTFYEQYPRILRVVTHVGYGAVVAAGFEPLSDVRATWSSRATTDGVAIHDSLESSGGLWAGSIELARRFGSFSFGARWSLVRGQTRTEWRRTITDPGAPLVTSALLTRRLAGGIFGLGALYHHGEAWTFGLSVDLPASLDETTTMSAGTRIPSRYVPSHEDAVAVSDDQNDTTSTSLTLPVEVAWGAAWKPGERLLTALDVVYRRWSQLDGAFSDTWRVALGAEVVPSTDYRSFTALQWPYRLGVRWEQHYAPSPAKTVNGWFVGGGVGLPIGQDVGRLDYAIEYGVRGSIADNLVRERVWRHTISVVGWERWFVRRPRR